MANRAARVRVRHAIRERDRRTGERLGIVATTRRPDARRPAYPYLHERGDDGRMGTQPRAATRGTHDRHLAAVARSLGWAQESAERGDYADALAWIRTVEAIGEQLPPSYQTKRRAWHSALANLQPKQGGS